MRCVLLTMLWVICLPCLAQQAACDPDDPADGREQTLRKGVELHDAGRYEAAVKVYQALLQDNPDDATALYEMAMTYMAMKNYSSCIDAARRAAAPAQTQAQVQAQIQARALGTLASCQDLAGQVQESLATFERAVVLFPTDSRLNYNYAVTLMRQGAPGKARDRLRASIQSQPRYSSPYRVYAGLLQDEGNSAAALFMNLRMIMLEGTTPRTMDAARDVAGLTVARRDDAGELVVKVSLSAATLEAEGKEFQALTLALPMSMASVSRESPPTRAAYVVGVIDAVLAVGNDLVQSGLGERFVWEQAASPVNDLREQSLLTPFLYHVAALARVDGGQQWLRDNRAEVEKLFEVLRKPGQPAPRLYPPPGG